MLVHNLRWASAVRRVDATRQRRACNTCNAQHAPHRVSQVSHSAREKTGCTGGCLGGMYHEYHDILQMYHASEAPALRVQALLVYLIYFYMAMASRESLLLLNGSNIRSWWIWHHYLSALTCIIVLTLPVDSPTLQRFMSGWLQWTVLQAILMLAQNMCATFRYFV
jgi:TMPIT-like protein